MAEEYDDTAIAQVGLYVLGERPAVSIPMDAGRTGLARRIADRLDGRHFVVPRMNDVIVARTRACRRYAARVAAMAPEMLDAEFHHTVGLALGYPSRAVAYYVDTGARLAYAPLRRRARRLRAAGVLTETEFSVLRLVPWVDAPDRLDDVVSSGLAFRRALAASAWPLPVTGGSPRPSEADDG